MNKLRMYYLEAFRVSPIIGVFLSGSAFVCAALFGAFVSIDARGHAVLSLLVGVFALAIRRWSDFHVGKLERGLDASVLSTESENASLRTQLSAATANRTSLEAFLIRKTAHLRETTAFIETERRKRTQAGEIVAGVKENKEKRAILNELITEAWARLDTRFAGIEFFLSIWKVNREQGVLVHERSKSRDGNQENYFAGDFNSLNLSDPFASPMTWLATACHEPFYELPSTGCDLRNVPFRFPSKESEKEIRSALCYRVGEDIETTSAIISTFANRDGFFDSVENREDFQIASTIVRQFAIFVGYELSKLDHCKQLHLAVQAAPAKREVMDVLVQTWRPGHLVGKHA